MNSEEIRVRNRRKVLSAGKLKLREAKLKTAMWFRANSRLLSTECMPLYPPSIWVHSLIGILGRNEWRNGMWGPQRHFPNCDHLSSYKTQTLIWKWLGTVWAGEAWVWVEEVSMKLILCLSSLECQ